MQSDPDSNTKETTPLAKPTWWELGLLGAIILLALALRLHQLGYKSLWLDEVTFVRSAQMGGLFGPYGLASISHPPGYLFIMRLTGSISHEEWLLRLPAMIASVLGVVAIWGLTRSLVDRVTALLAAFMLALSALHLEFAQEAHSYALFATLSTFFLWSLYWTAQRTVGQFAKLPSASQRTVGQFAKLPSGRQPSTRLNSVRAFIPWAIVVFLAAANLYVHYYALAPIGLSLIVFPCFLLAVKPGPFSSLWRDPAKRKAIVFLVVALGIVGLLFLPQLSSQLLDSARMAAERTQALEAGTLEGSFDLQPSLFSDTLLAFITNRTPWSADPLFTPAVAGLWLVGLAWLVWRRRAISVALLAWMLLPLPFIAWFALQTGVSFAPRRLIFILPVFLLVAAAGITALGRLAARGVRRLTPTRPELARWAAWAVTGLVVAAFVKGSIDPISSYYARPKQDWKGLATILRTVPKPDDAIIVLPNATAPLEWYYPGPHNVISEDLVPKLKALCETNPAIYVAVSGTGMPLTAEDAAWLVENYVRVPLKDLRLYYRNCLPNVWYGDGAEQLFQLARHPGLSFPAAKRALEEYQVLAAQQAASAEAEAVTPTAEPATTNPTTPATETAPGVTLPPSPTATPTPAFSLPDPSEGLTALMTKVMDSQPDSASGSVWLGAYHARSGDLSTARSSFEKAIEEHPDNWLAYALWGNFLANAGQSAEAREVVAQGLQVVPDDKALAELQSRLEGSSPSAGDAFQEAQETARTTLRSQDWAAAIVAAQNAVSEAPARFEGYLLLGDAYRGSGELSQALTAYRQATALAPHISFLHARQSEILTRQNQPEQALDLGLTALAIDESRWENWLALGRALVALSKTTTGYANWAGHALQKAVDLAPPESQVASKLLAEFQATQSLINQETAASDVTQTPANVPARRAQADAQLQAGLASEALQAYRSLAEEDPQDRTSLMGVAAALVALNRVDEAIDVYEQINALWPEFPFAHVRRGELLEQKGDLKAALPAYEAAVLVAPDNADLHFTLAFAYRRADMTDKAIAEFEAGLKLDPNRQAAQEALQELQADEP